ncbi:hypothetical protein Acsp05_51960 [Actinokineospora sp. NBRC 105648]|nr:hypothetical protein Acsp05_51960 [Actinokineospora sp. NBRC 105648]
MSSTDTRIEDRYRTRTAEPLDPVGRPHPTVWGATRGPIDPATLAAHDARGYSAYDALLSPAEVAAFRVELDRLAHDDDVRRDERTVVEKDSAKVRSIFEVHRTSALFAELVRDPRVLDRGPGRCSAPRSTSTRAGSTTCPASEEGVSTGTPTSRPGTPRTGCPPRAR